MEVYVSLSAVVPSLTVDERHVSRRFASVFNPHNGQQLTVRKAACLSYLKGYFSFKSPETENQLYQQMLNVYTRNQIYHSFCQTTSVCVTA